MPDNTLDQTCKICTEILTDTYDDLKECQDCEKMVCKGCRSECETCREPVCNNCIQDCVNCGANLCNYCIEECSFCFE